MPLSYIITVTWGLLSRLRQEPWIRSVYRAEQNQLFHLTDSLFSCALKATASSLLGFRLTHSPVLTFCLTPILMSSCYTCPHSPPLNSSLLSSNTPVPSWYWPPLVILNSTVQILSLDCSGGILPVLFPESITQLVSSEQHLKDKLH